MEMEINDVRSLALRAQDAENDGRAAFIVMGQNLYTPTTYRAHLEHAWRQSLNGSNADNSVLSEAYAVSAVAYSAIEYRANTLAELPLTVRQPNGKDAEWHPLTYFLSSSYTLFWHIEAALNIWGVSYLLKRPNPHGYPTALEWLHPEDVSPVTDADDNIIEYYWKFENLTPQQVVEIRTFDPGRSLNGKGALEVALSRVTTEKAMVTHSGSYFFNAARPDGMLVSKVKLNPEEQKKAQEDWQAFKGSKNAWRTFVSGGEWQWIPVTTSPKDLVIPDLKDDLRKDIAMIFRTHPALIGASGAGDPLSANSTMETLKRDHIQTVTLPQHHFICEQLNNQWLHVDFEEKSFYSLAVDEGRIPALSKVTSDRATTVSTLTSPTLPLLQYNEGREILGMEPDNTYIKRDPGQALALFNNTAALLDEMRDLIGLDPLPGGYGQVLKLSDGRLVKIDDLPKIFDQAVKEPLAPVFPFGLNISKPPEPVVEPPAPALEAPRSAARMRIIGNAQRSSSGCSIIMSLANNPALVAAQTLIKAQADKPETVEWSEPESLHVTLLYSDKMTSEQERKLYAAIDDFDPFSLRVSGLKTFDNEQKVLYLAVEKSQALADFQKRLYDQAVELEVDLSKYSNPEQYTPHVTVGYAPSDYTPPEFETNLTVTPQSLQFSREAFEITHELRLEQPAPPPSRSGVKIELAVPFAENRFVLTAQRILSRYLAAQAEGTDDVAVEWLPESDWRMGLISVSNHAYSDAARIINALDIDRTKVSLETAGYAIRDGIVGLVVKRGDGLSQLRESLALEAEAIMGLSLAEASSSWQGFIGLGRVGDQFTGDVKGAGRVTFPLTATAVTLYANSEPRYTWPLRGASAAQLAEMGNYERKVARRGAGIAFELDTLADTLAGEYLRSALAAGVAPDVAFPCARRLLTEGVQYKRDDIEPTPDEIAVYWSRFDDLRLDLGAAWLEYMDGLKSALIEFVSANPDAEIDVLEILSKDQVQLVNAWTGTAEEPGPLAALALAGMAAGNDALLKQTEMNPEESPTRAEIPLTIDWALLNQEAIDFARQYAYELIRGLNETSQTMIQDAVVDWLASGQPLPALQEKIGKIFGDEKRGKLIGQTEAIRVYNQGAFNRWESVGVRRATWQTVQDARVCPICRPLHGQVADITAGWVHPGGMVADPVKNKVINANKYRGKVYRDSAHPGCRCFRRPDLSSMDDGS